MACSSSELGFADLFGTSLGDSVFSVPCHGFRLCCWDGRDVGCFAWPKHSWVVAPAASSSAVAAQPASMQMQAMQQMALMASQQAYKEAMQKFEQMQQFSTMLAASAEAQGQGQGETPAPDGPEEEEEVVQEEPPGKEESPNTPAPKESKEKAADHGGPNEGKNLADDGQGATDLEQTEKEPEKPKSIYKRVGLLNVDSQTQLEVLARLVVKQPKKKFEPSQAEAEKDAGLCQGERAG